MTTVREFFQRYALDRPLIARFLDRTAHNWGRFDPELGYLHADYAMHDGIDGSYSVNTIGGDGARFAAAGHGRPCRINTYGDSYTHGDQVNDGETWQEYLAAHLVEPIRNFGIGGHGVYHAWRRMQREEAGANAAEHIVLNLYEDDHRRSVMSWRWLDLWDDFYPHCRRVAHRGSGEAAYFHANPWDHLAWDFARGDFVERRSLCPAPTDLERLCDPDWLMEAFAQDLHAQAIMAQRHVVGFDATSLRAHADAFAVPFSGATPEALARSAERVFAEVGLRSTLWVVDRARRFAAGTGRRLLVLLSYRAETMAPMLGGSPRPDESLVSGLRALGVPFVDIRDHHRADFATFRGDPVAYGQRYWVGGHYSPRGNHFFAFAVKDALIALLEPKPLPYQDHARPPGRRPAAPIA